MAYTRTCRGEAYFALGVTTGVFTAWGVIFKSGDACLFVSRVPNLLGQVPATKDARQLNKQLDVYMMSSLLRKALNEPPQRVVRPEFAVQKYSPPLTIQQQAFRYIMYIILTAPFAERQAQWTAELEAVSADVDIYELSSDSESEGYDSPDESVHRFSLDVEAACREARESLGTRLEEVVVEDAYPILSRIKTLPQLEEIPLDDPPTTPTLATSPSTESVATESVLDTPITTPTYTPSATEDDFSPFRITAPRGRMVNVYRDQLAEKYYCWAYPAGSGVREAVSFQIIPRF